MEMSWELLVLVWCLLVGNPCARVSPPTCSSQHLLCTWCLPSNRGGREWVWIHQGGSYDLPGIPDTGQPDWRFNCVLERVPLGYNCTIKMFPDPKGKWQGISRIWTEEISIPKLAAVKSSRLCCPLHHSRAENRPNFLWKFYKLQYVYNSKPVLKPFSLLIYIYILDLKFRSRSLFIFILPVPLCLFFSLSGITGYDIHEPRMLKNIPTTDRHSFTVRKGYGAAKTMGEILGLPCELESDSGIGQVNPVLGSQHSERAREEQRWGLCPATAGDAAPFFVLRLFSNIFVQFFLSFLLP